MTPKGRTAYPPSRGSPGHICIEVLRFNDLRGRSSVYGFYAHRTQLPCISRLWQCAIFRAPRVDENMQWWTAFKRSRCWKTRRSSTLCFNSRGREGALLRVARCTVPRSLMMIQIAAVETGAIRVCNSTRRQRCCREPIVLSADAEFNITCSESNFHPIDVLPFVVN